MKQLEVLKKHLKQGEVYRRADLKEWSTAVDRHLQQLVTDGTLEKLSGGLYYVPKPGVFGKVPADERELISAFLKDDRFVVVSPNDYKAPRRAGNIVMVQYLGADGRPSVSDDGYSCYKNTWDERGNKIEMAFFNRDGKPCLSKDGFAK